MAVKGPGRVVGQPRKATSSDNGGGACVLKLLLQPQEAAGPAPGGGLEVNLSRGEQGEGQEWVGTRIHTQSLLICC